MSASMFTLAVRRVRSSFRILAWPIALMILGAGCATFDSGFAGFQGKPVMHIRSGDRFDRGR